MKKGDYATPQVGKLKGIACKITETESKPMAFVIKAPNGDRIKFSNFEIRKSTSIEIRTARGGRA